MHFVTILYICKRNIAFLNIKFFSTRLIVPVSAGYRWNIHVRHVHDREGLPYDTKSPD